MQLSPRTINRRLVVFAAICAIIACAILLSIVFNGSHPDQTTLSIPLTHMQSIKIDTDTDSHPIPWHNIEVHKGDSLARIFTHLGLSQAELVEVLEQPTAKSHLNSIRPGQKIYVQFDDQHHLQKLKYPFSSRETLFIDRNKKQYDAFIKEAAFEDTVLHKSGVIKSTLAQAAYEAGLTHKLLHELETIFAGSVNLNRDLRKGDKFSILYREFYVNGKKDHPGNIIAATLTNHGKTYRAVRFTYPHNHKGYYSPNGKGVEPLFLRVPLHHYKRISDRFRLIRKDPYTHTYRPHLGIDYAAKTGTAIHAVGDGKVIFIGHKGGYGKAVIVRHSLKYRTLYGHMSRFAHLKVGQHVHKDQVIGYVGSTGWSTGPHLHFEMYIYGIPHNFLAMKFPDGKAIPSTYINRFKQHSNILLSQLKMYDTLDNT